MRSDSESLTYRPPGTEWLGEIPAHWEVLPLRRLARNIATGRTPPSTDEDYFSEGTILWITPGDFGSDLELKSSARRITSKAVQNGVATLFPPRSIMLVGIGATLGKVAVNVRPASANQQINAIIPEKDCDSHYLAYFLHGFREEVRVMSNGNTLGILNQEGTKSLTVLKPPLDVQRRIARFLDEKTARIDALIAKKRALLDRLAEKRQALITRAVTRGLDPDAPMKPSGIDWLGEIPAHWETGNIRRFASMKTGHTPSRSVKEYWEDCTIPWFTLADVWQLRDGTRWYLRETKEKISELGLANSAAELLPAGTVVFSRTASVGYSGIMPEPMATSQDFWNWVCGPKLIPEHLLLLFRSMTQKFEESTSGSTHKTIYQGIAAGLEICVPPLGEQRAIADYALHQAAQLDGLVAKVNQSIDRLAEYRAALVTAAVTGQIESLR
ncbi:MAG: restriction endonuclease subunit S [Bacteroidota bacterium]